MTVKALMPVRIVNLVAPLAHEATDMHTTDTAATVRARSGAAATLIGPGLRGGGVESAMVRPTPGIATSTTATRTTTTRATKVAPLPSADPHLFSALVKYYGVDQAPELLEPLHTVTTRDRFGLVTVKGEPYAIVDIGLRMLSPRELYRAQGFPESYHIATGADGRLLTKTAQVRMCGNSVCPPMACAIVTANYSEKYSERVAA